MRRVKRTITAARQRLPTPAIRYANGAAIPTSPAAADDANATPSASESSATDCASASTTLRIPWRSSPTSPVLRSMLASYLVGEQGEDACGRAVRRDDLHRRDDDLGPLGELVEVVDVLEDHPAGAEPDPVQVHRGGDDGIGARSVEAD